MDGDWVHASNSSVESVPVYLKHVGEFSIVSKQSLEMFPTAARYQIWYFLITHHR